MTESDGEAARGCSGLLGGAHFCAVHKTLAKQLAVERRVYAPLNVAITGRPALWPIQCMALLDSNIEIQLIQYKNHLDGPHLVVVLDFGDSVT